MRKNLVAIAMVCLLFLVVGQTNAMTIRAEAAPLWAPDTIALGTPFTVGIYMNNTDSLPAAIHADGYRMAYSTPFAFYSPDGSINAITHTNVGGDGPTSNINILNGFNAFWGMMWWPSYWSYDGALPDSLNFTGIGNAYSGWPFDLGEQEYIQFNFQSDETGTFCIDSIDGRTATYDWLLDPPSPSFNGPYCWTIYDTSYVPPAGLTIPDVESPQCAGACIPITVENFTGVAGVELHLNYDTTCLTYDSLQLGYLVGATVGATPGVINIIWENFMSPLTLTNGETLAQLCFTDLSSGACPISFVGNCELVDDNGDPISLTTFLPAHLRPIRSMRIRIMKYAGDWSVMRPHILLWKMVPIPFIPVPIHASHLITLPDLILIA